MKSETRCAGVGCKMHAHISASNMEPLHAELMKHSRVTRNYRRGDRVFTQGQPANEIYCIRSGHILMWNTDAFGHRTAFRIAGACELTGYRSFFAGDAHAATAEALSSSHICSFSREAVETAIAANAGLARVFLRTVARDRGPPDALMLRGQNMSIRVRLVYLLLILKDRFAQLQPDGSLVYEVPLQRRDIAAMLGVRAESVTRTINELTRDGVALFFRRTVTVPDPERLYIEANVDGESKLVCSVDQPRVSGFRW